MANGSGMQLSTGTVVEYKPGQRIGVRVSDKDIVTLDLDKNVRVDGLVAEGQLAAVMWMGDSGGGAAGHLDHRGPRSGGLRNGRARVELPEDVGADSGREEPRDSGHDARDRTEHPHSRLDDAAIDAPRAHADPHALGVGARRLGQSA